MNKDGLRIKDLEIRGKELYLGGEKLPYVEEFSLSHSKKVRGEPFSEAQYPMLNVKGTLTDDNGEILIKFGEIIKYQISERVNFVGGM